MGKGSIQQRGVMSRQSHAAGPRASLANEAAYLGLLAAGIALPYARALPWVREHGLDVRRFHGELFANRVSSFFGWDVIVSAATLVVLSAIDDGLPRVSGSPLQSERWVGRRSVCRSTYGCRLVAVASRPVLEERTDATGPEAPRHRKSTVQPVYRRTAVGSHTGMLVLLSRRHERSRNARVRAAGACSKAA